MDENKTTADGRYEFEPVDVVWEEGESGTKEFEVPLMADSVIEEPERLVLKMEPLDGNTAALVSPDSFTATIFDTDEPVFDSLVYSVEGYKRFAGEELFGIFNVSENGRATLKREEGKLPSGVSLKYDAQSGKVVLSGSPSNPGQYTVVYSISQNGKKGPASTITITVKDLAESNPFVGVSREADIPLYADVEGVEKVLAGRLNVSISKANKIRAKYYGTESKTVSFSGQWGSFDQEDDSAYASITTKKGEELDLRLKPDGVLEVLKLSGVANAFGEEFTGIVSGSVKIAFESGKTATGTFKGILQPGWFEDCGCGDVPEVPLVERPFASGTLYYTDRITTVLNGRTRTVNVKRSAPFYD